MDTRQQRPSQTQRPPYPQGSQHPSYSTTSSAFQSSSSLASISLTNTGSAVAQTARMAPGSVPLPSPSTNQPSNSYFGSIPPQTAYSTQQQRIPQQVQQVPNQYVGMRGDGGGAPETAPFLQDFSLVAEAAKRAQVACLSRDLGDIGL